MSSCLFTFFLNQLSTTCFVHLKKRTAIYLNFKKKSTLCLQFWTWAFLINIIILTYIPPACLIIIDDEKPNNSEENCISDLNCGSNSLSTLVGSKCMCKCKPNYVGDPNLGCRPGCVLNSDCPVHQACLNMICKDPCLAVCGSNARCTIFNHSPACLCKDGYIGNPYDKCIEPSDNCKQ